MKRLTGLNSIHRRFRYYWTSWQRMRRFVATYCQQCWFYRLNPTKDTEKTFGMKRIHCIRITFSSFSLQLFALLLLLVSFVPPCAMHLSVGGVKRTEIRTRYSSLYCFFSCLCNASASSICSAVMVSMSRTSS